MDVVIDVITSLGDYRLGSTGFGRAGCTPGFVAHHASENVRLTSENAALSLRLAALNADVERVEQNTQLGEFSSRFEALTGE